MVEVIIFNAIFTNAFSHGSYDNPLLSSSFGR